MPALFDRAFVINLDRCRKRWIDLERLSTKLSLPIERWPAVDGRELTPTQFPDYFSSTARLNGPEVGVCLSGIGIWREALRRGYSAVLVFEDDATTTLDKDELWRRFADAEALLGGTKYDLLYLGKCGDFCGSHQPVGAGIVKLHRAVCWHAYIVTARGMQRLLAALPMNKVGDEWVADQIESGRLVAYAFHPSLFVQNRQRHGSTLSRPFFSLIDHECVWLDSDFPLASPDAVAPLPLDSRGSG